MKSGPRSGRKIGTHNRGDDPPAEVGNPPTDEEIQNALRALRNAMGQLTQVKMAQQLGVSEPTIQRHERLVAPRGLTVIPYARLAEDYADAETFDLLRRALFAGISEDEIAFLSRHLPKQETSGDLQDVRAVVDSLQRSQLRLLQDFLVLLSVADDSLARHILELVHWKAKEIKEGSTK